MEFLLTYAVDFILLVIFVTSVFSVIRKGFLQGILSLIALFIALVTANFANVPAAEWCYDNLLSDYIAETVESSIPTDTDSIDFNSSVKSFLDSLPAFVVEQLDVQDVDIDASLNELCNEKLSSDRVAEEISNQLIRPGIIMLLRLVFFLVIFIGLRFLFGIVIRVVSKIANLPLLRPINKFLGIFLGLFEGLFSVYSLTIILDFISQLLNSSNEIAQAIENSLICDIIGEIVK